MKNLILKNSTHNIYLQYKMSKGISKTVYAHKLKETMPSQSSSKVLTGLLSKYKSIIFYTGIKDISVKDYVKSMGARYSKTYDHLDQEGNIVSDKKMNGWSLVIENITEDDINNLIKLGVDEVCLKKCLDSVEKDVDVVETKSLSSGKKVIFEIYSKNKKLCKVECSIIKKVSDTEYTTEFGDIVKTSRGWILIDDIKTVISVVEDTRIKDDTKSSGVINVNTLEKENTSITNTVIDSSMLNMLKKKSIETVIEDEDYDD